MQLFEEAAKALCNMPCVFCCPFIVTGLVLGFLAFWVYMMVLLMTSEGWEENEDREHAEWKMSDELWFKLGYMVLALFWVRLFTPWGAWLECEVVTLPPFHTVISTAQTCR